MYGGQVLVQFILYHKIDELRKAIVGRSELFGLFFLGYPLKRDKAVSRSHSSYISVGCGDLIDH